MLCVKDRIDDYLEAAVDLFSSSVAGLADKPRAQPVLLNLLRHLRESYGAIQVTEGKRFRFGRETRIHQSGSARP